MGESGHDPDPNPNPGPDPDPVPDPDPDPGPGPHERLPLFWEPFWGCQGTRSSRVGVRGWGCSAPLCSFPSFHFILAPPLSDVTQQRFRL